MFADPKNVVQCKIEKVKVFSTIFLQIANGVNGVKDRMAVIWERGVHSGMMSPGGKGKKTSNGRKVEKILKRHFREVCVGHLKHSCKDLNTWPQVKLTFDHQSFSWVIFLFFFGRNNFWFEDHSLRILSQLYIPLFQKGLIASGSDTDIVVWNLNKTRSLV